MKTYARIGLVLALAAGALLAACNNSGISAKPRAKFTQLACLDVNGDGRVNASDAGDPEELPDFNADGNHDEEDASFVSGVDITLIPAAKDACAGDSDRQPEYLVAHDFLSSADVDCEPGEDAVLVLGVAGGVGNLKDRDQAAGVRTIVDALVKRFEDDDWQATAVVAGAGFTDAQNGHTAMEDWVTNAVRVYLDRFACLRVVLVGFSHGGVTVEVVAARLEPEYADRFIAVVDVDRIQGNYAGDIASHPQTIPVFNLFQTNEVGLGGAAHDAPNFTNFDASAITVENDDGEQEPVKHTTMDNSPDVRGWIVDNVTEQAVRSEPPP
jgi:hypothetical protein